MGTLFGFVVGYVLGARAGNQGFEEVVQAARDVRDSSEFRALLDVVRSHVRGTAATVSRRLAGTGDADAAAMVERARRRAARG